MIPIEDLYPDFPKLRAAENRGCSTCKLLRHALLHRYNDKAVDEASVEWGLPREKWPSWDRRVTLKSQGGRTGEDQLFFEPSPYPPPDSQAGVWFRMIFSLHADPGDPVALSENIRRRPPSRDVLSPANMRLIFRWLDDCEADHAKCHHERLPRLPTRVIDVGPSDGSADVRLLVTGGTPGNYVVLSHCWGLRPSSTLNKESQLLQANSEDFERRIDIESLPKNFRDAILVVRKLEIRYLWIDALCVIQDSLSDWAKESAQMDAVYESAYLTLVATCAPTSSTGFIHRREYPVAVRPYENPGDPTIKGRYYITFQHSKSATWDYIENETVWNTRGWTFQERLLSRRILHVLPEQLAWECRTIDHSQNMEIPRKPDTRGYWILTKDQDPQPHAVPGYDTKYERWYWIASQ
ncbi:MAG: hypothetical protein Q9181_000159 [Wetmoreana brouardii]